MNYYKAINNEGLLAIYKDNGSPWLNREQHEADGIFCREVGATGWWWDSISKAEFGTYQAFGIKEIKLL